MTLHLKVQPNAWPWLDQAAREVNFAWNWANETSCKAVRSFAGPAKWLSAYDLDRLSAGAGGEFRRIGIDVVQRINAEYATRRKQAKKVVLRFRASGGRKRALGWIPFKAATLRVKGAAKGKKAALTFYGKSIRLFQMDRFLEFRANGKIRSGNFAQNSLGEWFLNVAVDAPYPPGTTFDEHGQPRLPVAPIEKIGIDLGLKSIVATSEGEVFEPNRSYRDAEKKLGSLQRAGRPRQAKRLHLKIKNRRLDRMHKLTRHLVNQAQWMNVGDVSLRFLAAGRRAKSAHDAAPGMFKAFLFYKGHWAGRSVYEVDEKHTTQTCSACLARTGPKGQKGLRVRRWVCTACGASHERDVNSACLIKAAAPRCRRPNAETRRVS